MNNSELDFVIKSNRYLEGGSKEACVIVNNLLKNVQISEGIKSPVNMTAKELEAIKLLIAASFQREDMIPERWHCDGDCKMVSYLLCPGECSTKKDSPKLCPHFLDESLV